MVQSNDYESAKSGNKNQNSVIQDMVTKLQSKIDKLEIQEHKGEQGDSSSTGNGSARNNRKKRKYHRCKTKNYLIKKILNPKPKDLGNQRDQKHNWKKIDPKDSESYTKTINNKIYK